MRSAFPVLLVVAVGACGGPADAPRAPTEPSGPPAAARPAVIAVAGGDSQVVAPGEGVPEQPRVVVKDALGRPMAGILVRFFVDSGGGVVEGDSTRTNAEGVAHPRSWRVGPLTGVHVLRATTDTLAPVHFRATARLLISTTLVPGSVRLPQGSRIPLAALRVATSVADVPVGADGTFTMVTDPRRVQLAGVEAPNGNVILLGWIDSRQAALSVRSTAEAMTYFDAGGFLARLPEHREMVRAYLGGPADLTGLESAIAAALQAPPDSVTLATPAILDARRAVVRQLASLRRDPPTGSSVLVSPSQIKSGVAIDPVGLASLTITNNWRRRAVAFVDRVSYLPPGGGSSIPAPVPGAPIKLPAVTPITSLIGTAIDVMFGNYAGTPVISAPVAIPLFPVDALSTRYRVTVVGPGSQPNSAQQLTQVQADAQMQAAIESILVDIVMPIIDQAMAMNNLTLTPGSPQVDNFVTKFLDLNPVAVLQEVSAGNLTGAIQETLKLIFDSSAGQQLLHEVFFVPHVASLGKVDAIRALDQRLLRQQKALQWFEIIATTIASTSVVIDAGSARMAEQWDVDVSSAQVRLNPPSTTISHLDITTLSAVVLDATGGALTPTFDYRWSTTGRFGTICAARTDHGTNYCGSSFTSSLDVVSFAPDVLREGTDSVTVEVYVREQGALHYLGRASASVTTWKPKVSVTPQQVTVTPGGNTTFTASLDRQLQDGGVLSYRWTTPGRFGNFGSSGTSVENPAASITYSAGNTEGTDAVTVDVFSTLKGVKRLVGSAGGQVEVKRNRPTTVIGSWAIEGPTPLDKGRSCVTVVAKFPTVQGARSYEVWGHGFNDPVGGIVELRRIYVPPFQSYQGCGLTSGWGRPGLNGSDFQFLVSGTSGPDKDVPRITSDLNSRFAGMVIEVTVRY